MGLGAAAIFVVPGKTLTTPLGSLTVDSESTAGGPFVVTDVRSVKVSKVSVSGVVYDTPMGGAQFKASIPTNGGKISTTTRRQNRRALEDSLTGVV